VQITRLVERYENAIVDFARSEANRMYVWYHSLKRFEYLATFSADRPDAFLNAIIEQGGTYHEIE
jgi:hypothetical protein